MEQTIRKPVMSNRKFININNWIKKIVINNGSCDFIVLLRIHKNYELCLKACENSVKALKHVPENLKTEEICHKANITKRYDFKNIPETIRTKHQCPKAKTFLVFSSSPQ